MANKDFFYVYEHWRLDRDECFYVGKGRRNRAYKMRDRNKHHAGIVAKVRREGFAIEVRIVESGLAESEAHALEVERIAFWRSAGVDLANYTNGGEGVSGLVMSNEAKAKMSAAKKGKPGNVTMLGRKHSDETRAKMSAYHKGRPKTPEHAAKVGVSNKGKVFSEETRAKMSAAAKRRRERGDFYISPESYKKAWETRRAKLGHQLEDSIKEEYNFE